MMLLSQPPIPPTPTGTNLSGQTIIITGANTGLGYESARQFLTLGASRVILACRSLTRGSAAATSLRTDPVILKTNPDATIEVFELDLASYTSGLRFAEKVKAEVAELDILVNNGGMASLWYERSDSGSANDKEKKTGHERMMQVNCYTHILISLELFPLLRATAAQRGAPTRITWLGSLTHITQHTLCARPIPRAASALAHFDDVANFDRIARYADSKLAVHAVVRRFASLAPDEVVVNNLCPGLVRTELDRNLPFCLRVLMTLFRKTAGRRVEEGARTVVFAAVVAGSETNGGFLQHNMVHP